MPRHAHTPAQARTSSAAQQWVLWLLVQALLALALSAGPRAIAGPLHVHTSAADHHGVASLAGSLHHPAGVVANSADWAGTATGAAARHHHPPGEDVVLLEHGGAAADDLNTHGAAASAAAVLWPASTLALQVPPALGARWLRSPGASTWVDAEASRPEVRPRG